MKLIFSFILLLLIAQGSLAIADTPTLADATATPTLADPQTPIRSVLKVQEVADAQDADANKIIYHRKRNIAPCAISKNIDISFCDNCCTKSVSVPVCAPPCACKEETSTTRDGKRVVHDYGTHSIAITARRNGTIEVDYRKKLFNR